MATPSHRTLSLAAVVLVLCVATLVDGRRPPRPRRPAPVHDDYERPPSGPPGPYADQHPAASGHGHHGRVQIKVYRGPDHGHHAPHGYWVKQPADDPPHHH